MGVYKVSLKQLMSNAGGALDANNRLYLMVKSVQPEWAAKITGMLIEDRTKEEIADVTRDVLVDWIGEAMFALQQGGFYVDWHEKYDKLKKEFDEHMLEMQQDAQHAHGSNPTDDELRKENEMLQKKYAQLVQHNNRELQNMVAARPEAVDGYEIMMKYVGDFRNFLDTERKKRAQNMIAIWGDKIRWHTLKNFDERNKYLDECEAEIITWGRGPLIHNKKSAVIATAERDELSD